MVDVSEVRTPLIAEIERALDSVAAGRGRVIVLDGTRGTGKSDLLAHTARRAAERGFEVATHRSRPGHPATTADECERTVATQTANPRAVVLDDAHLCDHDSLRALARLADAVPAAPVLLAIALRGDRLGDRAIVDAICSLDHARCLKVGPLDAGAVCELVRQACPAATAEFCAEAAALTGGNPRLLSELIAWVRVNSIELVAGAAAEAIEPIPPLPMRKFTRTALQELTDDACALATAVAIIERRLTLSEMSELTGLGPARTPAAATELLDAGLLAPGGRLALTAPIISMCLRAQTPSLVAAELHRRAAELALQGVLPEESGVHHLLLATPTGDPRVVDHLLELADAAVARGEPHEAKPLIRRAAAEDHGEGRAAPHVAARIGVVNLLEGRSESIAPLAAAAAGLADGRERADALLKLGLAQVGQGALRDASLSFGCATELLGADPLGAEAEASMTIVQRLMPETQAAAGARIEAHALESGPDSSRGEALLALAWHRLCGGGNRAEAGRLVERALTLAGDRSEGIGGYFHTAAAVLFAFIGEFGRAHAVCEQTEHATRESGSPLAKRNLALAQATTMLHEGVVVEAASRVQSMGCTGTASRGALRAAHGAPVLAAALFEQDQREAAEDAIGAGLASASPEEPQRAALLQTSARMRLDHDDVVGALEAINEAESILSSLGIENPAVASWRPVAAACYEAAGDRPRARAIANDAFELAEISGVPHAIASTLRSRARLERPEAAIVDLQTARSVIEDSGAELEHAKVLIGLGQAVHRSGRDREARSWLHRGIERAERLGALRVARRGLVALRASGGRPRRARMSGVDALTPAERRVVELASAGLSNPAIASELVIARKTVEWHLSKAFGKLGVSSRAELRAAVGG